VAIEISSLFRLPYTSAALLVCPGNSQGPAFWRPVARHLGASGTSVDVLGFSAPTRDSSEGRAGSIRRLLVISQEVKATTDLQAYVGILGHSAGCALALSLMAATAESARLVLMEPVPAHFGVASSGTSEPARTEITVTIEECEERLRSLHPLAAPQIIHRLAHEVWRNEGITPGVPLVSVLQDDAIARGQYLRSIARSTQRRTTLIRGDISSYLSQSGAQTVGGLFNPPAECITIAGSGHSPHVDRPMRVADQLRFGADRLDRR